jgi:hypothetical protein
MFIFGMSSSSKYTYKVTIKYFLKGKDKKLLGFYSFFAVDN